MQVPYTIPMSEFFKRCAALGQNAAFKATHVEKKIWIIFAVDRHKAFIPAECCDRSRQAVLDVPEHSTAKINVMLHEPHASIPGPAFPVVVAHNVLIIWIRVLCQITLNQITCFISCKPEKKKQLKTNVKKYLC